MFDLGIIPGLLTAIVSSPDINVGKESCGDFEIDRSEEGGDVG